MREISGRRVWRIEINDMQSFFPVRRQECSQRIAYVTYDANTTSRPHGEIDIDPIGWSIRKDVSCPKYGLSAADFKGLTSLSLLAMANRPSFDGVTMMSFVQERSQHSDYLRISSHLRERMPNVGAELVTEQAECGNLPALFTPSILYYCTMLVC